MATQTKEAAAPAKVRPVLFRSRGRNFAAVVRPTTFHLTDYGRERVPGQRIEFAPNGEYRTADPEEIEFLRGLESFNRELWEVGAEPDRPPDVEPVLEAITEATLQLDDETLARIEAEERKRWGRDAVLKSAATARRQVQKAIAAQG